jgi:hypothetical protein
VLRRSVAVGESFGMLFPEETAGETVGGELVKSIDFYGKQCDIAKTVDSIGQMRDSISERNRVLPLCCHREHHLL